MKYKYSYRLAIILYGFVLTAAVAAEQLPVGSVIFDDVSPSRQTAGWLDIGGRLDQDLQVGGLEINGYQATVDQENNFSLALPRADRYHLNLYDPAGMPLTADYAAPDQPVGSAVQAVVAAGFLDKLKLPLSAVLSNSDLAELLDLNDGRCAVDTVFLAGCDFYIDEFLMDSQPVIQELSAVPGNSDRLAVHLKATIPSANLKGRLRRVLGWLSLGYRDTTFNLRNLDLDLRFDVVPGAAGYLRLETDDADIEVNIGGMSVVQTNNLASYLVPVFKDALALLLNQRLVLALAAPYIEDIPIAVGPGDIPVDLDGNYDGDVYFNVNVAAETLGVLGDGDPYAVLSGRIAPVEVSPDRTALGFRVRGSQPPQPEAIEAPTDVRAGISVDLLNQLLMAIYLSAAEEQLQVSAKVEDFGRLTSQLRGLGIDAGSDITVKISVGAVPEAVAVSGGVYPLGLQVFLPKTTVTISGVSNGQYVLLLSAVGDFRVHSSLGAQADGTLQLEFGDDVLEGNITRVNGGKLYEAVGSSLPPEVVNALLEGVLLFIVDELQPVITQVLNAFPLGLDAGQVLASLLAENLPSLQVSGTVTETGMAEDAGYLIVGLGITIGNTSN